MKKRFKSGNDKQLRRIHSQTTEEAANELGVTVGRMHDLYAMGAPHDRPKKVGGKALTSAAAILKWAREQGIDIRRGPGRPPIHDDSPDLEAARLRKENALAAKYELQVKRELKELVPMDEMRQQVGRLLVAAKNRLRGLPPVWAVNSEGRTAAERQQIASEDIDRILNELAEDIRRLGEADASPASA